MGQGLTGAQRDGYVALAGALDTDGNPIDTSFFTDLQVTELIETAFNQTLRTDDPSRPGFDSDVSSPIRDGLFIYDGEGQRHSVDIKTVQDSSGFFLPSEITITKIEDKAVTVGADFVIGRAPNTEYSVVYDTVTGLNEYGLWFAGVENLELRLNEDAATDLDDQIDIVSARYLDNIEVHSGGGDDVFFVDSTHQGDTTLFASDGEDILNVAAMTGSLTFEGGAGDDIMRANYNRAGQQTFETGIVGELTLRGQAGGDDYLIGLAGEGGAIINVQDQSGADLGIDTLLILGTDLDDNFLFRPDTLSSIQVDAEGLPIPGAPVERVNYDADIEGGLTLEGGKGDDTFVLDDTSSSVTIYGGDGDDSFQVGQIFRSPREANAGLAPEDQFETTLTTRGYLSNGNSFAATFYGEDGQDEFVVFRNLAELTLDGGRDDDTFIVRSFVEINPDDTKAPFTNINGGLGADFISYTVNAPVNIQGGDGTDTVSVIGTEFGDTYIVRDNAILGAGRLVNLAGVEKVTIDAIEGNDIFFIESTNELIDLSLIGGLGSDVFNIGGSNGEAVEIVANDLEGHSGLVTHTLSSNQANGLYANIVAPDFVASIGDADSAGVLIVPLEPDDLRVFEAASVSAAAIRARYKVILTRPPEQPLRVTAAPVSLTQEEQDAGLRGISLVKIDEFGGYAGDPNPDGVNLSFDRSNWFIPQVVEVVADDDTAVEGRRFLEVKHSVIEGTYPRDGDPYDGISVKSLMVEVVDDDLPELLINESGADTTVAEAVELGATDSYNLMLSSEPNGPVTVTVTVADDSQILISDSSSGPFTNTITLPFDGSDWNSEKTVHVMAVDDGGQPARKHPFQPHHAPDQWRLRWSRTRFCRGAHTR